MLLEVLSRFVAGGSMIVTVSYLGRVLPASLAGIVVLFPAVTALGYYFLFPQLDVKQAEQIALYTCFGIPTVFAFALTVYFSLRYVGTNYAIMLGILAWLIVGGLVLWIKQRLGLG
ncbi:GlpM family protein [Thaumasiovibrio sp. DFM-14]|uniref:GlpM family protein n=1 Tax=Thaumasiovibrio sp. DFM-14 TaxID=3384792 RepID=UPI0039A07E0A